MSCDLYTLNKSAFTIGAFYPITITGDVIPQ